MGKNHKVYLCVKPNLRTRRVSSSGSSRLANPIYDLFFLDHFSSSMAPTFAFNL